MRNYANCDATVLGSQTHLLRHKRKSTPHTNLFCCRLGAATFHRHENLVTAAVKLGSLLVCVSCYGAMLAVTARVCENLHPLPRQNGPTFAKICTIMHSRTTQERIAKICAPPKSYYPRMRAIQFFITTRRRNAKLRASSSLESLRKANRSFHICFTCGVYSTRGYTCQFHWCPGALGRSYRVPPIPAGQL